MEGIKYDRKKSNVVIATRPAWYELASFYPDR